MYSLLGEITGTVRLMEEMNVFVGPVVHKAILTFTCIVLFFSLPLRGVMGVIWLFFK